MSDRAGNCPNCGAPIQFRWSAAVQTTCEYCHSILVRTDVDLKKVGEVADLWFHCLVMLSHYGLSPADVIAELERREGLSGIEEKAMRKRLEREGNGG